MYQCSTYFFEVRSLVHFLHTWCIKVRNRVSQFSMTFNGRFLRSRYMPFPWNGMTEEMSICGKSIELVKQQTKHINWGIINWGRESTLTHLPVGQYIHPKIVHPVQRSNSKKYTSSWLLTSRVYQNRLLLWNCHGFLLLLLYGNKIRLKTPRK